MGGIKLKLDNVNYNDLTELFEMLRDNGVQEFSCDGLSVKFGAVVHVPSKNMADMNDLIVDSKSQSDEDDDLLFYSAS